MGNIWSSGSGGGTSRRRNHHNHSSAPSPHPPVSPLTAQNLPPPHPEIDSGRYVFATATPYPPQNPNPPQYYQYPGYYPPPPPAMPAPLPAPFDHHHRVAAAAAAAERAHGRAPVPPSPAPRVEHQKAVTIRNDVNLKKETMMVEPDEQNPGQYLITFTFDATVPGSITLFFFAKESFDCNLTSMKESLLEPVTVSFKEGLAQKFMQPSGTGINFSMFEETELLKEGEMEVYPLAIKAEASSSDNQGLIGANGTLNSQITQAVFEKKDNGQYQVRVVKQILWVSGTRYELQEIYGIGDSVENNFDGSDPGKECVICLSEPRDTTVLPCRHMCMCSECAKVLKFQTNRCPICRQPVERLLEIKVNNRPEEQEETQ